MNIEEYNSEIDFLFSQIPSYQKVGKIAYKPGIESMLDFDKRLESPHKKFKTIHVAGTNGKGSVSHMLASVLISAGYRVGLYTSPHLVDFRERVKVNGVMLPKEFVFDFLKRWKGYFLEFKPSFFEITTGLAFDYFAKEKVDIAIIETGLGGRLDSTNIITPILSVITNIGLDHCDHLGFSVSEIAVEKAGIIKREIPVVIGERGLESTPVFLAKAKELSAPIFFAEEMNLFPSLALEDVELKGACQRFNFSTVKAALSVLMGDISNSLAFKEHLNSDIIASGLATCASSTGLRGRWERLSEEPRVICDTGHNSHGLKHVCRQLAEMERGELLIVLGVVADKDLDSIKDLLPKDARYYFANAKGSRALSSKILAESLERAGLKGDAFNSVEEAIEAAVESYSVGDLIFIGGSTYVVAEAIEYFC